MIWKKKNKKHVIGKIKLTDSGFQITDDNDFTEFIWDEITSLKGFKIDRLVVDDICLEINADNKKAFASEEFEGWQDFMKELLNHFPGIDKDWEGIIAQPPFERNETELYNRKNNVG